jgi:antitoxin (DNA-binding transcriptional repressor) of toxin-antitoxin stability system
LTSIEIASSFTELEEMLRHPNAPTEPVVLTKNGVAFAALVPVASPAGLDAETRATWNSPAFQAILARSRADTEAGREQPLDEVRRELGVGASRRRRA